MIDPDWLKTLNFESHRGLRVVGLAGIGSQKVVLAATTPNGEDVVIKAPKRMLGFHLNEVPPKISARAEYRLDQVNEKLRALVGRESLDLMSFWLDDLYSLIIKIVSEAGIPGLIFSNMSSDSVETIPFIIHTPPVARRLQEIVDWVVDEEDPLSMIPTVNGEKYMIRLIVLPGNPPKWAQEALEGLSRLPEYNKELQAPELFNNWLIVWGIAAMEGFFSDDEMPLVAQYLESQFGRVVDRPDVVTLLGQADALANLFAQYFKDSPVDRFVKLCAHCGVVFQACDKNGRIVADGMRMLTQ